MHPLILVCNASLQWVAYPCRPEVAPKDISIIPMTGIGNTPDEAIKNLEKSMKDFVDLHGVFESNQVLDSIYGRGNHVDLKVQNHPMMKYFTEIN